MIHHVTSGNVDLWHAKGGDVPLTFLRDESTARLQPPEINTRWASMCAQNPRLFDGPITSIGRFDPDELRLTWQPSSYKSLVVQPEFDTGTWQLSTTVLLCKIIKSRARVLVARRSDSVHTYPGSWEFGPSGGIDPPAGEIDRQYLLAETRREANEELGIDLSTLSATVVGLFRDAHVRSYDVLVRVVLDHATDIEGADWEYCETRWASLDKIARMVLGESARDDAGLCPPSAAIASRIGDLIAPIC